MAITFEKTWQFNVNQSFPTSGVYLTDRKNLLVAIVAALTGFASSPWVVYGSCNAVTFGYDGVNRWNSAADIVNGYTTSPGSWMVLHQPGMDAYLTIGVNWWTDMRWINFLFSQAGPPPQIGTLTANPWAGGVNLTVPNGHWYDQGSTAAVNHRLHAMQSTDGKCTRIFVTDTNAEIGFFGHFDELLDVPARVAGRGGLLCSWNQYSNDTTKMEYAALVRAASEQRYSISLPPPYIPYSKVLTQFATEFSGSLPLGESTSLQGPNGISGGEILTPMYPMDVAGQEIYGRVPDMWFGPKDNPHGSTYPAAGPIVAAQFQHVVIPWPNLTPVLV